MNRLPLLSRSEPEWTLNDRGLWVPTTNVAQGKVQRDPVTGKYNQDPVTRKEISNTNANDKCCCTGGQTSTSFSPGGCGCDGPMPRSLTVTFNVPLDPGCEFADEKQCVLCSDNGVISPPCPPQPAGFPADIANPYGTRIVSPIGSFVKSYCIPLWTDAFSGPFYGPEFDPNCIGSGCAYTFYENPATIKLLDYAFDSNIDNGCAIKPVVKACDKCSNSITASVTYQGMLIAIMYACATYDRGWMDNCIVQVLAQMASGPNVGDGPLVFAGAATLQDCKCTSPLIVHSDLKRNCIIDGSFMGDPLYVRGYNAGVGIGGTAIITPGC